MAGIDLLFAGDHYKICEANSSPGFQGIESCCDIDVPRDTYHFIRIRNGLVHPQLGAGRGRQNDSVSGSHQLQEPRELQKSTNRFRRPLKETGPTSLAVE